ASLSSVVFPLPLGPRRPTICPRSRESVSSDSAKKLPYFLVSLWHSSIGLIVNPPLLCLLSFQVCPCRKSPAYASGQKSPGCVPEPALCAFFLSWLYHLL